VSQPLSPVASNDALNTGSSRQHRAQDWSVNRCVVSRSRTFVRRLQTPTGAAPRRLLRSPRSVVQERLLNGAIFHTVKGRTPKSSLERVHKPPTCPPHVLIDPRIRWCHPHTILRPPAVTRRSAPAPAPFLRVSNRTRVAGASSGDPRNHRCGPRWVENETWELGGLWTRSKLDFGVRPLTV